MKKSIRLHVVQLIYIAITETNYLNVHATFIIYNLKIKIMTSLFHHQFYFYERVIILSNCYQNFHYIIELWTIVQKSCICISLVSLRLRRIYLIELI